MLAELTAREKEVVAMLAQGLSNKQIAALLAIAECTVKNHLRAVYIKTNTHSRAKLILSLRCQINRR